MIRLVFLWCLGILVFACSKKPIESTTASNLPAVIQQSQDSTKNNPLSTVFLIEGVAAKNFGELEKAESMLKQAIQTDNNNDAAYFELSNIYSTQELYNADLALENMQKAQELKPENELYQLSFARMLVDSGQYEKGISLLKKLSALHPTEIDYSYDLAYAYEQADQIDQALKVYDELEEKYGFNAEINHKKHVLYFSQNEYEKGIEEIKEIVENNPQYTSYAVFLAEFYLKDNQYEEAEKYAKNVLSQDPANTKAFAIVLQSLSRQGKKADFLQSLNQLTASNIEFDTKVQLLYPLLNLQDEQPTWQEDIHAIVKQFAEQNSDRAEAYALLGDLLYNSNRQAEAETVYKQSLAVNDETYSVWDQLINYYVFKADYKKLAPFAELASSKFPERAFPPYISGYAYYRAGFSGKAVEVLESASKKEFDNTDLELDIMILLADAYHENKQYQQAYLTYDKVLLKEPDNAHVLNNYSYYLAQQKQDLDKAEKMAARAMQLNPQDANTLDTFGWVLYQKGNYTKAVEVFSQAVEQVPDSAVIIEHYGDALYKTGEKEQAIIQWRKALKLDATNATLQQKIETERLD